MEQEFHPYFGIINVLAFINQHEHGDAIDYVSKNLLPSNVKFVHYPDCQQLIIWLPEHGNLYDTISLQEMEINQVIWKKQICDILSGSVQIVLDTLPISVGNFEISIIKKDGLNHKIQFVKYPEVVSLPTPKTETVPTPIVDNIPIVYRDGFGKVIPNEDLILRDQIIEKTFNKISRKVEYMSQGREGKVIYIEGEKSTSFYMEMGGGNCVFYLLIPPETNWEKRTNFPLGEREEIINFVASSTQRDQAPSCYFKISDTEITYFRR